MPRAVSREPSGAGLVSRAGLVHGTARGHNDMWYDLDTFLLDQVCEVLDKLEEGNLDDAIWGKIVIMEKCKRVAKAYLRKTTIIVDGSEDEFDGSTLGFNCFDNTYRDENTEEIRQKIGDGVILKVDYQGNIKGMARGTTPVICLGFKDSERRKNCISDRLARLQGRLNTNEEDKAFKIFDMRRFKSALDREISDGQPDAKNLLLKTTVRVALVKDGGDMNRTPCWFTVINLIALDTLKSRIPNIKNMSLMNRSHSEAAYSSLPTLVAPTPIYNQPANSIQINQQETYGTNPNGSPNDPTQALTQLIAAAVKQANGQTISQSLHNLPVSVDQLATLASSLSLGKQEISQQILAPQVGIKGDRKDRRRNYKVPSADDSSGEDSALRSDSTQGECQPRSRNKRWDQTTKSIDAVAVLGGGSNVPNGSTSTCANSLVASRSRSPDVCDQRNITVSKRRGPPRPRLQDVMFDRSYSTTSDYDSNRELFDSGSWSSNGSNCYQGRSPASSVVSDSEGHARLAKPKQIEGHNGKLVQLRQAPPPQRAIKEVPLSRQQVVRKELHRQTSTNFNRLPSITASAPKAEIYEHEKEKDERKDRTLDHPSDRSSKPRLTYRLSGVNVPTPTTKPPPPPHEYDEPEVTDEMISIVPVPATNHDQASTSMKDADSIPLHATIVSTDDEEINTLPPPKPPSPDYTDARRQTATITVSEGCRSVEGRLWEKQRPSTGSQRATSFVGELRRVLLKRNSFKEQQNAEQNNNK
ncbi:unnamed protein product, partial [Mesorhabditis belari]|uniref:MH2 domain-containing protein n=1 Tax=Mesorhabditis belari TaxID=2138241 RepID=A0AAF3E9W9_9BILA